MKYQVKSSGSLTYSFIVDLMRLLFSGDWREASIKAISDLESQISELETTFKKKKQQYEQNWAKQTFKATSELFLTKKVQQQDIYRRMDDQKLKQRSDIREKIKHIESCIEKSEYALGYGIFKPPINKWLLENTSFFVYVSKLGLKPADIILKTLAANFDLIYDTSMNSRLLSSAQLPLDDNIFETPISEKQLEDSMQMARRNDAPDFLLRQWEERYKLTRSIDTNLLEGVKELLAPILAISRPASIFYRVVDFDNILYKLAYQFGSIDRIIKYLSKLDLSTHRVLENSIVVDDRYPDLSILSSPKEKESWYEFNLEIGKPALKLFTYSDLLKKSGINILTLKIIAEYVDINPASYNRVLFELLSTFKSYIAFAREKECPELAQLCREYSNSEQVYNNILDTLISRRKDSDDLPNICFFLSNKEYSFEKLQPGHLKTLFIGKMSECCYGVEEAGDGDQCVKDAFTRKDAGFYVLKKQGMIVGAINAWIGVNERQEDVLVFNSLESRPGRDKHLLEILQKMEVAIKDYNFSELYFGAKGFKAQLEPLPSDTLVKEVIKSVVANEECTQIIYDYLYNIQIVPKYDGLFVYRYAEFVHKVTQSSQVVFPNHRTNNDSPYSLSFDVVQKTLAYDVHPQIKAEIEKYVFKETIKTIIPSTEATQIIYNYSHESIIGESSDIFDV